MILPSGSSVDPLAGGIEDEFFLTAEAYDVFFGVFSVRDITADRYQALQTATVIENGRLDGVEKYRTAFVNDFFLRLNGMEAIR